MTSLTRVLCDLREFGYWKSRRDALVRQALDLGVPVERIAAEMQVSESVVRKIKREPPVR